MNRILLIFLLFVVCSFAACTKSSLYGSVQVKAQGKIDDSLISRFIISNHLQGKAKHVQGIDTIGVYYIVIDSGSANTLFTNSTQVTVGDTGYCIGADLKESKFYQTNEYHPSYLLGSVLRAWQLGIPEVGAGGLVRLLVPSRYAYGHFAHPELGGDYDLKDGLPANAVLDFYIRLYAVTN